MVLINIAWPSVQQQCTPGLSTSSLHISLGTSFTLSFFRALTWCRYFGPQMTLKVRSTHGNGTTTVYIKRERERAISMIISLNLSPTTLVRWNIFSNTRMVTIRETSLWTRISTQAHLQIGIALLSRPKRPVPKIQLYSSLVYIVLFIFTPFFISFIPNHDNRIPVTYRNNRSRSRASRLFQYPYLPCTY